MKFVNLHHHSTFSFGDGYGTPAQHVARAAELGYSALALTEHGNTSSFFQLEKYALKAGIKPIFGLEGYCGSVLEENDERRLIELPDGEVILATAKGQFKNHLTILAKDQDGYQNLNRIVTQSYRDFFYHPTISGTSLANNASGLIILSGCSGSLLACTLLGGKGIPEPEGGYDWDGAAEVIARFIYSFGDNYYLEIQPFHELERTCKLNAAYVKLSKAMDVPLVVTGDVHYPRPEDAEMQAILHAVHRGKATVDDQMREWNYDVLLTLPESDEILADKLVKTGLSPRLASEAIKNSAYIADQCNVTLPKAERLRYTAIEKDLEPWV
jgi:DNA polymerase III subunit alpha